MTHVNMVQVEINEIINNINKCKYTYYFKYLNNKYLNKYKECEYIV